MVFADMQMPMPVGGTQPKEGALAKLGGSDRCVERGVPDRLRRALSDRTGERAGLCGGRHGRKPGDRARLPGECTRRSRTQRPRWLESSTAGASTPTAEGRGAGPERPPRSGPAKRRGGWCVTRRTPRHAGASADL